MLRDAVKRISILAAIAMSLVAAQADARSDASRSFTLAARQWLLIERMTNSALLAAMRIDVEPRLSAVHWSRDRFDRTLSELRYGDPALGLSATTRREIIETLDRVDIRWQRYDAIFREVSAAENVTDAQIRALTQSHEATTEALADMVGAYRHFIHSGVHHSILSPTIDGAEQLRARTQLLLRCLLSATYHQNDPQERRQLAEATRQFDRVLAGLANGDADLRLMAPPSSNIRGELARVETIWSETRPILNRAAEGGAVTEAEIAAVAENVNEMALPLTMALLMYLTL